MKDCLHHHSYYNSAGDSSKCQANLQNQEQNKKVNKNPKLNH